MSDVLGRMQIETALDDSELKRGLSGMKRDLKLADNQMKKNLSSFEHSDRSAQKLGVQVESLGRKHEAQAKVVEAQRVKYEQLRQEKGDNSVAAENARIALEKEEAALGNTSRQLDNMKNELAELEQQQKIANSRWTKMGDKLQGMGRTMSKTGDKVMGFGKRWTKMGGIVAGGAAAAGGALYGLTNKVTENADAIAKASQRMGVSSDFYQEMDYWASQNGISQQSMERALGRLNQRMGRAADGNEKYSGALENLGVNMDDVKNGTVSTEDAMATSIQTLSQMETEQEKSAAASELFGTKMARDLMPALQDGSLTMEEAKSKAQDLGLVMSEDQLTAASKFQDAQDSIKRAMGAVGMQIGLELMPTFQKMLDWILANMPTIQSTISSVMDRIRNTVGGLIDRFQSLTPATQKFIGVLGGIAVAGGPVLVGLGAMMKVFGSLTAVVGTVFKTFGMLGGLLPTLKLAFVGLTGPVGLVVAGIAGLTAAGVLLYKNWDTVKERIGPLRKMFEGFRDTVGKVGNIFKKVVTDGKVMTNWIGGLPNWLQGPVEKIAQTFVDWRARILRIFNTIVERARPIFKDMLAFVNSTIAKIQKFWSENGQQILQAAKNVFSVLGTIVGGAFTGILATIEFVMPAVMTLVSGVWNGIKNLISGVLDVVMGLIKTFSGLLTGDFSKMWEGVKQIFKGAIQAVWGYINILFVGRILRIGKVLFKNFGSIAKAGWDSIRKIFTAVVQTIFNFLKSRFTAVVATISAIFYGLRDFFSNIWSTISSVFRTVVRAIVSTIQRLFDDWITGVRESFRTLRNFFSSIWSGIQSVWDTVTSAIVSAAKWVFDNFINGSKIIFRNLRDFFQNLWSNIRSTVVNLVQRLWNGVKAVWDIYSSITRSLFQGIANFLSSLWSGIRNTVVNLVQRLWNGVKAVWDVYVSITRSLFRGIADFLSSIWSGIRNTVVNLVQRLWDRVKVIFNYWRTFTVQVFRAVRDFLQELWSNLRTRVVNIVSNLWARVKSTWNILSDTTRSLFGSIRDFLTDLWDGVRQKISNLVKRLRIEVIRKWRELRYHTQNIFRAVRDFLQDLWSKLRDKVADIAENLWNRVKNTWNTLFEGTKSLFRNARDFLLNLWRKLRDTIADIAQNLWNRLKETWNTLFDGTKGVFRDVRDWLGDTWDRIWSTITGFADDIASGVKGAWDTLWDNTKEIFNNIKDWVSETFDNMVDLAKGLPERLGDGISSMASKLTSKVTNLINSVAGILEKGVNFVIGGVNWVLNKLGGDDPIGEFTIDKVGGSSKGASPGAYAQGTNNHPGGLALVGDGKGSNAGSELIGTPDGKMHLSPSKPTMMDLPKGTSVLSARDTKNMMAGMPKYAFGIGWIKDKFQDAKEAVANTKKTVSGWGTAAKDKIMAGLDKLKDVPGDFYNKWSGGNLLATLIKKAGGPIQKGIAGAKGMWDDSGFSNDKLGAMVDSYPGKIADQTFERIMELGHNAVQSMLPSFDKGEGRPDFGPAFVRRPDGGFGSVKADPEVDWGEKDLGQGKRMHYGIDYLAPPETPVKATAGGTVTERYEPNGQMRIKKGEYEYAYAHMKDMFFNEGDKVKKGDKIGTVGAKSSNKKYGYSHYHLHYGVKKNGEYIDPDELGGGYEEPETMYDGSATGFSGIDFGGAFRKSSGYGGRDRPGGFGSAYHRGVDYAARRGTPIQSQSEGIVSQVKTTPGLGKQVWVKNGNYEFVYGHMSRQRVKEGQEINRGDVLGNVGSTGRSTGPHVHFGVRKDGSYINPANAIQEQYAGSGRKDVQRWVKDAVRKTGVPSSWRKGLETIAMHESGGDPGAYNDWDINARMGRASRGLMQTIPSTFNAHNVSGWDDIYNPKHNAAAAIRYIQSRYGDIDDVPGLRNLRNGKSYVGYEDGGFVNKKQLAWLAEGGHSESVISHDPSKKESQRSIWKQTGDMLGFTGDLQNSEVARLVAWIGNRLSEQEKRAKQQKQPEQSPSMAEKSIELLTQTVEQMKQQLSKTNEMVELLAALVAKDPTIVMSNREVGKLVEPTVSEIQTRSQKNKNKGRG